MHLEIHSESENQSKVRMRGDRHDLFKKHLVGPPKQNELLFNRFLWGMKHFPVRNSNSQELSIITTMASITIQSNGFYL